MDKITQILLDELKSKSSIEKNIVCSHMMDKNDVIRFIIRESKNTYDDLTNINFHRTKNDNWAIYDGKNHTGLFLPKDQIDEDDIKAMGWKTYAY